MITSIVRIFKNDPLITNEDRLTDAQIRDLISYEIFGSISYLQNLFRHHINIEGKVFSSLVSEEALQEMYGKMFDHQLYFGGSWNNIQNKFLDFFHNRFNKEFEQKEIRQGPIEFDRAETPLEVKQSIRLGLSELISNFLGIDLFESKGRSTEAISLADMSRLLTSGSRFFGDNERNRVEYYTKTTFFKWIANVREWTERSFISALNSGNLKRLKLGIADGQIHKFDREAEPTIKDGSVRIVYGDEKKVFLGTIDNLKSQIEDYIINDVLLKNPFEKFGFKTFQPPAGADTSVFREKLSFTLEIFDAVYSNLPEDQRSTFTLTSLRKELSDSVGDAYELDDADRDALSRFGSFVKNSVTHQYNTLMKILSVLNMWTREGGFVNLDRESYAKILKSARDMVVSHNLRPGKQGYYLKSELNYDKALIQSLGNDYRTLKAYFETVEKYGGGDFPYSFFRAFKTAKESFRASYWDNPLAHTDLDNRLSFIEEFMKLYADIDSDIINFLVDISKHRNTDEFVKNNKVLMELINPSTSYNDAPSHEYVAHEGMQHSPIVLATEVPIYTKIDGNILLSGHIDYILLIDGKIYFADYKPNLNLKTLSDSENNIVGDHFINSVPQLSMYVAIFQKMFNLKVEGCITFNEQGSMTFNPKDTLNKMIEFYKNDPSSGGQVPEWAFLYPLI